MKPVYILSDNIITSLGFTTAENIEAILHDQIGIKTVDDPLLYHSPIAVSLVDTTQLTAKFDEIIAHYQSKNPPTAFTRLEKLFILSIHDSLIHQHVNTKDPRTLLVISTTKGNIVLLEDRNKMLFNHKRLYLWELARVIQHFFGFVEKPLIISNACISGVVAVMAATRFIQNGLFDNAVVTGGDIASEFVISGFQSFQALSSSPCKPFDLNRTGLSLGEGCGTMILSVKPGNKGKAAIKVAGAATTNDANHISGPSRTGEELSLAIKNAMKQSEVTASSVDYISAHGTATPFNDEMESKAIGLSELSHVPVNSLKGYWGHTLGGAGLIESVAAVASMKNNMLYCSAGFETPGVSSPLNIITKHQEAEVKTVLKTASGFGGCNAAIIYQKE
ncbi:MAG: beta-ketoacyl synthase N-terminal-like domain-containing protein [Bacteroidota bacterium]